MLAFRPAPSGVFLTTLKSLLLLLILRALTIVALLIVVDPESHWIPQPCQFGKRHGNAALATTFCADENPVLAVEPPGETLLLLYLVS